MADVLPDMSSAELAELDRERPAEAAVYRAARALPDLWVILYGLRTLFIEEGEGPRDREGDFVVLHPSYGLLVIEVKGGKIIHDERGWCQVLPDTTKRLRKDPIAQAVAFKHCLIKILRRDVLWEELNKERMLARHALFFPDVRNTSVIRSPAVEQEVVGGYADLANLEAWVELAYGFGTSEESWCPLETRGVACVREILFRPFTADPILGFKLRDAEEKRLCLTREQIRVVKTADRSDRCVVVGGAGTGKTVLALRQAQDFARGERRTLLLGYNRPLVDALRHENCRIIQDGKIKPEHLRTCTFDSLCGWVLDRHVSDRERYLREAAEDHRGSDRDEVLRPVAMEYALDESPLAERFEAVVIDEAQDFNGHHWAALRSILEQADKVLVFHDANQKVHRLMGPLPPPISKWQSLPLTRNCRNTDPIFQGVYLNYLGPPDVESSMLEGPAVKMVVGPTLRKQADLIAHECHHLICKEGVGAADIAVLIVGSLSKSKSESEFESERIAKASLSRAFKKAGVTFVEGHYGTAGSVLLDTVRKFKGLEAEVVFLWATGDRPPKPELLYVGMSRSKYLLVVVSGGAVDSMVPA